MLGSKALEISASWNYALLGYRPEILRGIQSGQSYLEKPTSTRKCFLEFNSDLFRDRNYVEFRSDWCNKKRGEAFLLTVGAFLLTVKLLCLQSLRPLLDALSHCKQKNAPIVSGNAKAVIKKAPTVSKEAKIVNCK